MLFQNRFDLSPATIIH